MCKLNYSETMNTILCQERNKKEIKPAVGVIFQPVIVVLWLSSFGSMLFMRFEQKPLMLAAVLRYIIKFEFKIKENRGHSFCIWNLLLSAQTVFQGSIFSLKIINPPFPHHLGIIFSTTHAKKFEVYLRKINEFLR